MEIKGISKTSDSKIVHIVDNGDFYYSFSVELDDAECLNLAPVRHSELLNELFNKQPSYAELREKDYLEQGITEKEMMVALWERVVENRPEASNKLQFIREQIKAKYPKVG